MARYVRAAALVAFGALAPSFVGAQDRRLTVGGDVETRLEVEGGRAEERGRVAGQIRLRPTIALDGAASVSFDLVLTTPPVASGSVQPEEYAVGVDWGGAQAGFGHVRQTYSALAVQDVSVLGGRFFLRRRGVRLSAFGGRANPPSGAPSPVDRRIQGGRIGVGDPDNTAFDVIMIRAWDEASPLAAGGDGVTTTAGVSPTESRVLGAVRSAVLFDRSLSLRGEIMRSALTPDARAPRGELGVPGETTAEHASTVDWARSLEATARLSWFTATVRYRSIGDGYQSPGVRWLPTDKREIGVATSVRLADWVVGLNAARERDNLAGDESSTTAVTRIEARLALPAVKRWTTRVEAKLLTRSNDAAQASERTDGRTWILAAQEDLRMGARSVLRSASVRYEYEGTRDGDSVRTGRQSDSHALNVQVLTVPADAVRLLPSLRLVRSRRGLEPSTLHRVYAMQAQHETGGGRLRLGLEVRRTERPEEAWWAAMLTSRLALGDPARQ